MIAKKYFYALRPVLACRWVLDRKTPPPMLFSSLVSAELPDFIRPQVEWLLKLKINSPEVKEIPRIDILNEYIAGSVSDFRNRIADMEEPINSWDKLNTFFLHTISQSVCPDVFVSEG